MKYIVCILLLLFAVPCSAMGQKPKVVQVPYAVVVHDTVKINCPDAKKVNKTSPRKVTNQRLRERQGAGTSAMANSVSRSPAIPCTTVVRVECALPHDSYNVKEDRCSGCSASGTGRTSAVITPATSQSKEGHSSASSCSPSNPDVRPSLTLLVGLGDLTDRGDVTIIEPPAHKHDKPEAHDPPYERNGDIWTVHALLTVPVSNNLSLLGGVDHWSLDYGHSPMPTIVPDRERTRFTSFSVGGKWYFGR